MRTKLFQSVSKLSAEKRWCLTGTPIQNSLQDLASLVAFIRSVPLDDPLQFQKKIVLPLMNGAEESENNLRKLLDSICLRRTKKILNLPSVHEEDHVVEFSAAEMSIYLETQVKMIATMKQHDSQTRNSKNYFGIFQLTLQLRRLCNHGTLQQLLLKSTDADKFSDQKEAFEYLQEMKLAVCTDCNNCIDSLSNRPGLGTGILAGCGHLFCLSCLPRYGFLAKTAEQQCPQCTKKSLNIAHGNFSTGTIDKF